MSDLSRMLDDLYALPDTDADDGFEPTLTKAPAWSSEEALDEAFSSWVPGPGADATATQRSLVADAVSEPFATTPAIEDWLHDTEPEAEPMPEPEPEPEPVLVAATSGRWVPSDDDILPARRGPRRRRR